MRTESEILKDIQTRFEEKTGNTIANGSTINLYSAALATTLEDVYVEIENNKNPHVWTKLTGKELDATGIWVNLPRDEGESDSSYKYRLMQWVLRNEASNTTAIQNKLLNPQKASNITYVPKTRGCGTGTCYVIPKEYTIESMEAALLEAKERMAAIASDSLYVEYVIPKIRQVNLEIHIQSEEGDLDTLKEAISAQIKDYINTIPPGEYLSIGKIDAMGIQTKYVDYFSVLSLYIDSQPINKLNVLQTIESKFIFDEIVWIMDDEI